MTEASSAGTRHLLLLSSDPSNASRLRVAKEQRSVEEVLRMAAARHVRIQTRVAVRASDISDALAQQHPDIIHFSGHGMSGGEICVENDAGEVAPVGAAALAALFAEFPSIECVVLNSCYSSRQADVLARTVPVVVCFEQPLDDPAAVAFAAGFYKAVAAGRSYSESFRLGVAEVRLEGFDPDDYGPRFISRDSADKAFRVVGGESLARSHVIIRSEGGTLAVDPMQVVTFDEMSDLVYFELLEEQYRPFTYGTQWIFAYEGRARSLLAPYRWALSVDPADLQPVSSEQLSWQTRPTLADLDISAGTTLYVRPVSTFVGPCIVVVCDDRQEREQLRTNAKYISRVRRVPRSVPDLATVPTSHIVVLRDWLELRRHGSVIDIRKHV